MDKWLEDDLAAYLRLLPDLLHERAGKFALIHDGKLVDTFQTASDALAVGYERFALSKPFFVKEIAPQPGVSSPEPACHS